MIKFVAAALWISAATLGSVYFAFNSARPHAAEEKPEPGLMGGLDYVGVPLLSIPVMVKSEVIGYFLAKLVYTIEPEKQKKLILPAEVLLTDEFYSHLYGNPQIDFTKRETLDLDALRAGLRDAVNARVGEDLVQEVLITQVDFLSKQDIRDNTARRRKVAAEMEAAEAAPTPKKDAGGGH
jgi:hypothetical protein